MTRPTDRYSDRSTDRTDGRTDELTRWGPYPIFLTTRKDIRQLGNARATEAAE